MLFMSHSEYNELAEVSYQHHYHYEVWENGKQVAELISTGHVLQLGTRALFGAVNHACPQEEGFLITRYTDFQPVLVGKIRDMTVEITAEQRGAMRATRNGKPSNTGLCRSMAEKKLGFKFPRPTKQTQPGQLLR